METIGMLLGLIGTLALLVSYISVLWPLKRLGLPTRGRSALAALFSFLMIMAGVLLMSDKVHDQAEIPSEPLAAPRQPEAGMRGGYMSIRVLDEDLLDDLKTEALSYGQDPGFMYPARGRGPMAIGVLPLNSLGLGSASTLLPLLCKATVARDPGALESVQ